jgi:hypothetical protein
MSCTYQCTQVQERLTKIIAKHQGRLALVSERKRYYGPTTAVWEPFGILKLPSLGSSLGRATSTDVTVPAAWDRTHPSCGLIPRPLSSPRADGSRSTVSSAASKPATPMRMDTSEIVSGVPSLRLALARHRWAY